MKPERPVGKLPAGGKDKHLPQETQSLSSGLEMEMHLGLWSEEGHWHSPHFGKAQIHGEGEGDSAWWQYGGPWEADPSTQLVFLASTWW